MGPCSSSSSHLTKTGEKLSTQRRTPLYFSVSTVSNTFVRPPLSGKVVEGGPGGDVYIYILLMPASRATTVEEHKVNEGLFTHTALMYVKKRIHS